MARSPNRSLRWLTLAVMLPLLLLAVLAWMGTRSQLNAAWTEAREEATRRAEQHAALIGARLNEGLVTVPIYHDPPVPGSPSEKDRILDGNDVTALLALREDPGAGLSPAGLPRRVLAALRIHSLDPTAQDPRDVFSLVTTDATSVLTTKALEIMHASEDQLRAWAEAEEILRIARQDPDAASRGFWKREQGRTLWIENTGASIRYLSLPKIIPPQGGSSNNRMAALPDPTRPAWLELQTPLLTEFLLDEGRSNGALATLLADVPIQFGSGLSVQAYAYGELLEKNVRRQQWWTIALLLTAVLVSTFSLSAVQRAIARERRLAGLKSQFVSSVSHELRAPLGAIRLMAEALEQEKVRRPAEFHKLIAREGHRLSHLIENVLDFSRIEDGRKRYRFEECDLTALVQDTLELMEPLARDRHTTIEAELAEVTATVDPAAIQQALVNLLDNAIKFSQENESVSLSLRESAGRWKLAVRDHGPGVPAAEQERIFERFHRLGNELRREHQGSGIGLSIVKHIAEAHDGDVAVASTSDGSTFTLSIPLEPCAS